MKNIINQTIEKLKNLSKYERIMVQNTMIEVRGKEYRGIEIILKVVKDMKKGDYFSRNMIYTKDLGTQLVFKKLGLME